MSKAALLQATLEDLRSALGYSEADSDVADDGRPHPRCGEHFAAVHPTGEQGTLTTCFDDLHNVSVTLTQRIQIPFDRRGRVYLLQADKLQRRANKVKIRIHSNYLLMNRANALIDEWEGSPQNGYVEPLFFLQMDARPREVSGRHFHAEGTSIEAGLVIEVRFGKARRIQYIEYAT